ncbi:MAG TPA: GNAT family N-acetyltransferase [Clostridiales bacterium]|nr:GNAT family N-acetyltransferase [Clostridiales bacterium]
MQINDPVQGLPLHGPRIELTALEANDLTVLQPFFQDMAALTYFIPTTARPLNAPQLSDLLSDWNDGLENFVFAIRSQGRLLGMINLDGLDWPNGHAEIGIAITEPAGRGHGYASEAIMLLIRYAFDELGLHRVWARVIEDNLPSLQLFDRLGFQREGCLRQHVRRRGKFRDMIIFGLLNDFIGK